MYDFSLGTSFNNSSHDGGSGSYMSPVIAEATDALHEYTEPINSRVFRKADALPEQRCSAFIALRNKYQSLMVTNFAFQPVTMGRQRHTAAKTPAIPVRGSDQPLVNSICQFRAHVRPSSYETTAATLVRPG